MRDDVMAPGAMHRYIWSRTGPWAVHVIDVDRDQCWMPRAVKGADGAVGRKTTSALLAELARNERVIGGVNADFFLFTPPGVPTNAHISRGTVVSGPIDRPVFAVDSSGRPFIGRLRAQGSAQTTSGPVLAIAGWNRVVETGVALFDRNWGAQTDSGSGRLELVLGPEGRLAGVDSATAGVTIPVGGRVLIVGRDADTASRRWARNVSVGTTVTTTVAITPFHPLEAVGGRPLLVRDSALTATIDTDGGAGFAAGRHPRTAVGIARDGRRLIVVVVDGRQPPYSDGMTLRELGNLMLALGAREAVNLDGGGSTAMVAVNESSPDRLRVVNRPSDAGGERPVANALAIVSCRAGR